MGSESCDTCGRDGYNNPAVSVDAVALRQGEVGTEALLIRRGAEPVSYTHLTLPPICSV